MVYIDTREEREFSDKELLNLLNGNAKPYPNSYYTSEQEIINYKNTNFDLDWEAMSQQDKEDCYGEFVCPVNRWEYLSLSI